MRLHLFRAFIFIAILVTSSIEANAAETKPLKILFLTGGGYHDYKKLVPYLTNEIGGKVTASFDVRWDLNSLQDPHFADAFDLVLYDVCFDEAGDEILQNAINSINGGKPSVMLHCAVHAFRRSPKIRDWETCCGMRSKVHDRYEPFTVQKLDAASPITREFPDGWKTEGDELYQTISIDPQSHPLLKVKSPQDGREHIVSWTYAVGKARVFATTLGHDMKTVSTPEYIRLVSNGVLWAARRLK